MGRCKFDPIDSCLEGDCRFFKEGEGCTREEQQQEKKEG